MSNQIWMEVPFYENHKKVGLSITEHNHKLAEYSTKERALEVLDEIQKYIADSFSRQEAERFFGGFGTTRKSKVVYEMPKE